MLLHSEQNLLYCFSKFVYMTIDIDKRKTNCLYVDKENNHVANTDDIIKLVANGNKSNIDTYLNIISGSLNLTYIEIEIVKYLIENKRSILSGELCNIISKIVNKSIVTVSRAITSLNYKKVIIHTAGSIILSSSIVKDIDKINKAKFIIIEVQPEITSKNISVY